jgi:hypothetical protein
VPLSIVPLDTILDEADRRLTRDEEKRLLDTALQKMSTAEHQFVGALLHDRIIDAWSSAAGAAKCC